MKVTLTPAQVHTFTSIVDGLVSELEHEADPALFPAAAKPPAKRDDFDQHARIQAKNNALKTVALIKAIREVVDETAPATPVVDEEKEEMRKAEAEAQRIVRKLKADTVGTKARAK